MVISELLRTLAYMLLIPGFTAVAMIYFNRGDRFIAIVSAALGIFMAILGRAVAMTGKEDAMRDWFFIFATLVLSFITVVVWTFIAMEFRYALKVKRADADKQNMQIKEPHSGS